MHAFSARAALREFELAYDYAHASPMEAQAIESELFLNIGSTYSVFQPLLDLFTSGPAAAVEFNRLALQLLPAGLAGAGYLIKLPALADLFQRASWRATLTHLTNADPALS